MIESSVQNKKHDLWTITTIGGIFVYLVFCICCLIGAAITKDWSIIYTALLCSACGVLGIWLTKVNTNLVMSFAIKLQKHGFWRYLILVSVNLVKYFLIVLPLLIELIIKATNSCEVFELISMIVGVLISPCYIIISQVILLKYKKKLK